ncbi:unnamed protein product [Moneuplotes crassus]|uniref:Uncharacterized protein n=1 Tax=Euplotes crassus TaxID=5936 RepID=A0AAD1UAB7_EUPCR|nr:unnamed protein product [Moneuplotes crassus]
MSFCREFLNSTDLESPSIKFLKPSASFSCEVFPVIRQFPNVIELRVLPSSAWAKFGTLCTKMSHRLKSTSCIFHIPLNSLISEGWGIVHLRKVTDDFTVNSHCCIYFNTCRCTTSPPRRLSRKGWIKLWPISYK